MFTTVASLSFLIEFPINSHLKQDFFFFEGKNQSAHLCRDNQSLILYVNKQNNFTKHTITIEENAFIFSWDGLLVNNNKMRLDSSSGIVKDLHFDHFTFMSPNFDLGLNKNPTEATVLTGENIVNYWYIVLIVFLISALFNSKDRGIELVKKLFNSFGSNSTQRSFSHNLDNFLGREHGAV
jgi:hypothetical protein